MHRSIYRIVYDMLKVLKKANIPLRLSNLYLRAKIRDSRTQDRYLDVLTDNGLALASGYTYEDTAIITQKGLRYIATYKTILEIMGDS